VQRPRLREAAQAAGVSYPPASVRLIGLKEEKQLEVWFQGSTGWQRVRTYAVLAASGGPGPKLREGDLQVPEGIYRLTAFNPNSSYHLSVRVDYPNADDRAIAAREKRTNLGGDIFIHGKAVSIGCLAIGDSAIEELYVLLADTGLRNSLAILAPSANPRPPQGAPEWVSSLYGRIREEMTAVRSPQRP
jgi:murein L,D-transpeptidase YafK